MGKKRIKTRPTWTPLCGQGRYTERANTRMAIIFYLFFIFSYISYTLDYNDIIINNVYRCKFQNS